LSHGFVSRKEIKFSSGSRRQQISMKHAETAFFFSGWEYLAGAPLWMSWAISHTKSGGQYSFATEVILVQQERTRTDTANDLA
jgi:hypothetical protein